MARLKSLTLSAFRSFADDHTVAFPSSGLVLVAGNNKDSKGGSGSGKSTVLLALAFALGYCPYPATALQTRKYPNTMKVELTLDTPDGTVRVRRTKNGPALWVNGVEVRGGAKAVEERLRQILGVEPDLLSLLTYRGQRKPGLFLSKTDAEKKELLTRLIPRLAVFEQAIEKASLRVKELEPLVIAARDKVDMLAARLEDFPVGDPEAIRAQLEEVKKLLVAREAVLKRAEQAITTLTKQRDEAANEAAAAFADQIRAAGAALDAIQKPVVDFDDSESAKLLELVTSATARMAALVKADQERQKADRAQRQLLQQKILACRQLSGQRTGLEKEHERVAGELAALLANNCPTCERPWDCSHRLREELRGQLEDLQAGLLQCDRAQANELELQDQVDALPEFEPNPMIAKLQSARTSAEEQLRTINGRRVAAEATATAQYRQARAEAESELSRLKLEQQAARQHAVVKRTEDIEKAKDIARLAEKAINEHKLDAAAHEHALEDVTRRSATRQKLQEQIAAADAERHVLQVQINEEKDVLGAMGREGFLGSVFDEVLDEISEETNKILASVANTRHCTLVFKSENVTAKGTIKRAIVPVITVDGEEAPFEAGTSGGMQSVFELAVDLALGRVVMAREGVSPGWLVLDESFGGLGPVEMESALEILQEYAQDRLVLIVDHATEFKSRFTNHINVEYENGKSRFVAKEA